MDKILGLVANLYFQLFGSAKLLPLEEQILQSWLRSLHKSARTVVDAQLRSLSHVRRQAEDSLVCFYYKKRELPNLLPDRPNLIVAALTIEPISSEMKNVLHAKIVVHRGRLFSIEYSMPPNYFFAIHRIDATDLRISKIATICNLSASISSRQ